MLSMDAARGSVVAAVGGVGVWWCGVVDGGEGLGAGGSRDRTNSVCAGARGELRCHRSLVLVLVSRKPITEGMIES